jgi:radical SAM protein with 4Fe4S-binding SPASM domain
MFKDPEKYALFLKRKCNIGREDLVIRWNGDIKPCVEMDWEGINLFKESYEQIVEKRAKLLQDNSENSYSVPKECESCAEVSSCRGCCRVMAREMSGGANKKYPFMTEPLQKPLNVPMKKYDFINCGFKEEIKSIRYREESGEFVCCLEGKFFKLSKSEFALLKLLIIDEDLLHNDIKAFAKKYELNLDAFNTFLNKISRNRR